MKNKKKKKKKIFFTQSFRMPHFDNIWFENIVWIKSNSDGSSRGV